MTPNGGGNVVMLLVKVDMYRTPSWIRLVTNELNENESRDQVFLPHYT